MNQAEAVLPGAARARALKHTFMVDASFDHGRSAAGIGMVVQAADRPGRKGAVIAELCEAYAGVPSGSAEEFAVFRALQLARESGWRRVAVRSDYNGMRRRLKEEHRRGEGTDRDDLHGAVLRLAAAFDEVRFGYVPRRKNQRAHFLARRAAKTLSPKPALAYVYWYTNVNRWPPAEADLAAFFAITAPSAHQMVLRLDFFSGPRPSDSPIN